MKECVVLVGVLGHVNKNQAQVSPAPRMVRADTCSAETFIHVLDGKLHAAGASELNFPH